MTEEKTGTVNLTLENVILSDDELTTIEQYCFDDMTYEKTQKLMLEWLDEVGPDMDNDTESTPYDKILFIARLIFCHGFAHGVTIFNETIKSLVSEA